MTHSFHGLICAASLALLVGCTDPAEAAWNSAAQQDTPAGYAAFLANHDPSPRAAEARTRREELRWLEATQVGTTAAFDTFLQEFETGAHASQARGQLEKLRFDEAEQANSVNGWRGFLDQHPDSARRDEATTALASAFDGEVNRTLETWTLAAWTRLVSIAPSDAQRKEADYFRQLCEKHPEAEVRFVPGKLLALDEERASVLVRGPFQFGGKKLPEDSEAIMTFPSVGLVLAEGLVASSEQAVELAYFEFGDVLAEDQSPFGQMMGRIMTINITMNDGNTLTIAVVSPTEEEEGSEKQSGGTLATERMIEVLDHLDQRLPSPLGLRPVEGS
jgi:hypothetical protein